MAERRYYRVAGHVFSLEASAACLDALTNYLPFRISEKDCSPADFRFHLTITEADSLDTSSLGEPFFVDASDEDMPRIEVYRSDDHAWTFGVSVCKASPLCSLIHASGDFREATVQVATRDVAFAINNATMLLFAFATAPFGTLEMHAAVIVRHGKGYLFLGKSGTGKSTHARLWLQAFPSAWLLNDDNPIIRDGVVYGSPWSGKTPCYKNASAPIAAIVKLSQAPHNEMRLLRLPEAYAYMLSSASGLKIVPEMMDALYQTIYTEIQRIPLFHLDCLPNTAAAQLCFSTATDKVSNL